MILRMFDILTKSLYFQIIFLIKHLLRIVVIRATSFHLKVLFFIVLVKLMMFNIEKFLQLFYDFNKKPSAGIFPGYTNNCIEIKQNIRI